MAGSGDRGRAAFDRQAWATARAELAACRTLDVDDLERLAVAAYLVGADDESVAAWERAHEAAVGAGAPDRAARSAAWLSLVLLLRGEMARAGGWRARAERMVHDAGAPDAGGLLLVPAFLEALHGGDVTTARAHADEMLAIAQRTGDPDVLAFGLVTLGEVLLAEDDVAGGMRSLDEAMLSVTAASPVTVGIVYCAVIEACMRASEVRRASEWTDVLQDWCAQQPDLVPFRGQCLVHRSQVLQRQGRWVDAAAEAARARELLERTSHPALGLACYQQGELHRLRGELPEAEGAYRAASEHGFDAAPGVALLRLEEGATAAARSVIERVLIEQRGGLERAPLLAVAVEVWLSCGDLDAARVGADELSAIAASTDVVLVSATAAEARGAVLLAAGEHADALRSLRAACAEWRRLDLPYEVARTRVEIALACRHLGDADTAAIELDQARAMFGDLGAAPDLARVEALAAGSGARAAGVLTEREWQVLQLVAAGRTNRDIAGELVISEHTVARHLQNIFSKLGVSSRTAAAAYAHRRGSA